MGSAPIGVKRGRLSKDELERIFELGESGQSPGRIALRLNRHPGTVNYAMHRLGLRKLTRRNVTYLRRGVLVKSFSAEEDAFLEALRVQSYPVTTIAAVISKRFGHPRSAHTINVRLIMLASAAEAVA